MEPTFACAALSVARIFGTRSQGTALGPWGKRRIGAFFLCFHHKYVHSHKGSVLSAFIEGDLHQHFDLGLPLIREAVQFSHGDSDVFRAVRRLVDRDFFTP